MEEQTAKEYVGNEQRFSVRTDLALEARELVGDERSEISGVRYSVRREGDYEVTISVVEVLNEEGEKAMGKPKGRYVTLECPELKENILEAHQEVMEILTRELRRMIPLKDDTKTLVIGLGNRQVTADALGPLAVSGLLVTRHLYAVAPHELKDRIRPVSAIAPGVMGQTGVETGELVAGLTDKVKPDVVIAIDALASRRTSRVNTTIQIADTGINPGAGVGNFRQE
ncbi:MAG: GPR endopeptidase, partial [Clostridia bacterium]